MVKQLYQLCFHGFFPLTIAVSLMFVDRGSVTRLGRRTQIRRPAEGNWLCQGAGSSRGACRFWRFLWEANRPNRILTNIHTIHTQTTYRWYMMIWYVSGVSFTEHTHYLYMSKIGRETSSNVFFFGRWMWVHNNSWDVLEYDKLMFTSETHGPMNGSSWLFVLSSHGKRKAKFISRGEAEHNSMTCIWNQEANNVLSLLF